MPFEPENYPEDWKERIRPAVLKRDNYKCAVCGVRQRAEGYRTSNGEFVECDDFMGRWASNNGYKVIKIHLAVAHLNHDTRDNRMSNLQSMCQQCHNRHDSGMRGMRRRIRRANKAMKEEREREQKHSKRK